ncbi:response regulator, partial [Lysobacter sp. D1-1-M9]|uniref:response regulator n=1 Tax=Novilysobacter longmucuonensis TaxID=3098603 RepID=UPI002FC6F9F0
PPTGTAAEAPRPDAGRGETILVVEDDPSVRESAVDTLQSLGYVVVEAGDATQALEILGAGRRIDLLFTDVVMPGPIQSPELAERARSLQPGMAVLFTSGYTEDVVFHDGRLDPGIELIDKPYLRDELAARLRHLLGDRDNTRSQGGLRILLV